jgi:phosphoribosylaminoimidazole (AIR) synthetase
LSSLNISNYDKAGVNIKKIQSTQKNIGKMIAESYSFQEIGKIVSEFGHYSGLINIEIMFWHYILTALELKFLLHNK